MSLRFSPEVLATYSATAAATLDVLAQPASLAVVQARLQETRQQLLGLGTPPPHVMPLTTEQARAMASHAANFVDDWNPLRQVRPEFRVYVATDAVSAVTRDTIGNSMDLTYDQYDRAVAAVRQHVGEKAAALLKAVLDLTQVLRGDGNLALTYKVPGHPLSVIYMGRAQYEIGDAMDALIHEYFHVLQYASGLYFFTPSEKDPNDPLKEENGSRVFMEGDALVKEARVVELAASAFQLPTIRTAQLERYASFLAGALQLLQVRELIRRHPNPSYHPMVFSPHALGAALFAVAEAVHGSNKVYARVNRGDLSVFNDLG